MRSHYLQEKFDEIRRSDRWWEFENLASLPVVESRYLKNARSVFRELRQLDCRFNIREMLKIHPFCACSFSLDRTEYWENLPQVLSDTIDTGLESYYRTLKALGATIRPKLKDVTDSAADPETADAARSLAEMVDGSREFGEFSTKQLQILRKIFDRADDLELVIDISHDSISVTDDVPREAISA
jgi:hypothetical protein